MHANQASASVDILVHVNRDFYFESRNIGKKISVDFGRNANDKIGMNPSRTIIILCSQITSTNEGSKCNVFDSVRSTSDLAYRGLS